MPTSDDGVRTGAHRSPGVVWALSQEVQLGASDKNQSDGDRDRSSHRDRCVLERSNIDHRTNMRIDIDWEGVRYTRMIERLEA